MVPSARFVEREEGLRKTAHLWLLVLLATVACGGGGTSTATQSSPTSQSTPTSPVAASGEYTVIVWSSMMEFMGPFNAEFDRRYTKMKVHVPGVFQARLAVTLNCMAVDAAGTCTAPVDMRGRIQAAGIFFLLHGTAKDVYLIYGDAAPGGLLVGEELHSGLCHFTSAPKNPGNAPQAIPAYARPYNCPGPALPAPTG